MAPFCVFYLFTFLPFYLFISFTLFYPYLVYFFQSSDKNASRIADLPVFLYPLIMFCVPLPTPDVCLWNSNFSNVNSRHENL
ncbi:hypothetical protein CEQ20_12220 [Yersinia pseudotuberculosis]|nr:hypothetical protein CEQ20_12220 [Yersinia pseudotuberculosis]AYX09781.1 hypothetical protein EGX52_02340 [Yersinia pseudotuberculosis]MBO1588149.1 hypothetical protein [Yersinia pseudotuberculosis]PEI13687.1 hypothetical protein CRM78_10750 [Yersinia pseudotuberculosis]CND89585.1 Uncharacterised protein [Yersinia pseudotuberculosis]